jgi:hypothetical protein
VIERLPQLNSQCISQYQRSTLGCQSHDRDSSHRRQHWCRRAIIILRLRLLHWVPRQHRWNWLSFPSGGVSYHSETAGNLHSDLARVDRTRHNCVTLQSGKQSSKSASGNFPDGRATDTCPLSDEPSGDDHGLIIAWLVSSESSMKIDAGCTNMFKNTIKTLFDSRLPLFWSNLSASGIAFDNTPENPCDNARSTLGRRVWLYSKILEMRFIAIDDAFGIADATC